MSDSFQIHDEESEDAEDTRRFKQPKLLPYGPSRCQQRGQVAENSVKDESQASSKSRIAEARDRQGSVLSSTSESTLISMTAIEKQDTQFVREQLAAIEAIIEAEQAEAGRVLEERSRLARPQAAGQIPGTSHRAT